MVDQVFPSIGTSFDPEFKIQEFSSFSFWREPLEDFEMMPTMPLFLCISNTQYFSPGTLKMTSKDPLIPAELSKKNIFIPADLSGLVFWIYFNFVALIRQML